MPVNDKMNFRDQKRPTWPIHDTQYEFIYENQKITDIHHMNASENMPNKDQMIAKDQKMHIFLPIMQKIS